MVNWLTEFSSQCEMCEGLRKIINWLVELKAKKKMGEMKRENMIHWLIRITPKFKVCKMGRKAVRWLVEVFSQGKMGQHWRPWINSLVEIGSKEVGNGCREMINRLVEVGAKLEMSDRGREKEEDGVGYEVDVFGKVLFFVFHCELHFIADEVKHPLVALFVHQGQGDHLLFVHQREYI